MLPGYEKKLDALVECALGVGPEHLRKTPHWLMKLGLLLFTSSHEREQMFKLLHANAREWREIARLDRSYENY